MTRIGHQNLTSVRRTGVISYDRTLEFLVLYNNNPVPLYVRLGSPEIPNEFNYDIAVPPNYIMAVSVNSNQFGFRLGNSNVVITQITGNTVIEATIDEAPPSLGGVPINNASLSTADLLNGVPAFNGVTVFGPFNVNQWGGLIVNVIPTATSGQGVIQVDVSADGVTFIPYQTWAFWQNIPATILIPRVSQFCRITLNATAIVGEPAIAGNVSIRGSLAEIAIPSYTPQGASITKTYALAASGSQQYQFVTTGYPAVSIAAIATAGTGASAAITLLVEASSDLVNWRQVTFRTQRMTTGITLYRALGNLDLFMRVTVFEVGGISAANGTVYLSIPSEADTGAILNTIQQSLGDTGAPTNTNQDIYHELDNIRTGINTSNTNLGTSNANLAAINASDAALASALTRGAAPTSLKWPALSFSILGTYYTLGSFLVPSWYLTSFEIFFNGQVGTANQFGFEFILASGTNAVVLGVIWRGYVFSPVVSTAAVPPYGKTGQIQLDAMRAGGYQIPAGHTDLWGQVVGILGPGGNVPTVIATFTQIP